MAKIISSTINESKNPFQLDYEKYKIFLHLKTLQFNLTKNKPTKEQNKQNT